MRLSSVMLEHLLFLYVVDRSLKCRVLFHGGRHKNMVTRDALIRRGLAYQRGKYLRLTTLGRNLARSWLSRLTKLQEAS